MAKCNVNAVKKANTVAQATLWVLIVVFIGLIALAVMNVGPRWLWIVLALLGLPAIVVAYLASRLAAAGLSTMEGQIAAGNCEAADL